VAKIIVFGGVGWDRPITLDRPLTVGGRLTGTTLDGELGGRLGGGGANIAAALAAIDHSVWLVSRVGTDEPGIKVIHACRERNIDTSFIIYDERKTQSALILIEPNGERVVLGLDPLPHRKSTLRVDWQTFAVIAPDLVIFRAPVEIDGMPDKHRPIIIAHMPWPNDVAINADFVVGSRDDLGEEAWVDPLLAFANRQPSGPQWSIVTKGACGINASNRERKISVPAHIGQPIDCTGAGDIFIAGLGDALIAGARIEAAISHAAAWGALAVGFNGSAPQPGEIALKPFAAKNIR